MPDDDLPTYRPQGSSPGQFALDKRNGKVLGVCAGIANYVGWDVTMVRLGMVVATFVTGGMMLPIYAIAGFIAPTDRDASPYAARQDGPRRRTRPESEYEMDERAPIAERQPPSHTRFYRDKRNGKVLGVCSGIADYTGMDVTLVRVCMVAAVCLSGGAMIPAYLLAGIITPVKPQGWEADDREQKQFWQKVRASPARAARDIRSRMREIDRRLADIESYVTTENRSLAREIEQLR